MLPEGVPLVRLEDGRPFGADLPLTAPGVVKRGQGWPGATAGGGASAASGLEGASWPVFCGQVWAEGPLENRKSACGLALSPAKPGQLPVKVYRYYYRFAPQSTREMVEHSSVYGRSCAPKYPWMGAPKYPWISDAESGVFA